MTPQHHNVTRNTLQAHCPLNHLFHIPFNTHFTFPIRQQYRSFTKIHHDYIAPHAHPAIQEIRRHSIRHNLFRASVPEVRDNHEPVVSLHALTLRCRLGHTHSRIPTVVYNSSHISHTHTHLEPPHMTHLYKYACIHPLSRLSHSYLYLCVKNCM